MIKTLNRIQRTITWGAKDPQSGKLRHKYTDCNDKWVPGLDGKSRSGLIKTGLTQAEELEFEKKLGMQPGTLTRTSSYWNNFSIIIPEEGLKLDTEDPMGALMLKLLGSDSEVAMSNDDAKSNATALYVLSDVENEATASNAKREVITKAYMLFGKMTQEDVVDALYLFGKEPASLSPSICKDKLGDILDENPAKFIATLSDEKVKDKVWIIKLTKLGIVKKIGYGAGFDVQLVYGDIQLGKGLDAAVTFLQAKENSNIYVGLKKAHEELINIS